MKRFAITTVKEKDALTIVEEIREEIRRLKTVPLPIILSMIAIMIHIGAQLYFTIMSVGLYSFFQGVAFRLLLEVGEPVASTAFRIASEISVQISLSIVFVLAAMLSCILMMTISHRAGGFLYIGLWVYDLVITLLFTPALLSDVGLFAEQLPPQYASAGLQVLQSQAFINMSIALSLAIGVAALVVVSVSLKWIK